MATSTDPKPMRYIFLDLDDTLYPKSSGINVCVANRIAQYMYEVLGIENANEKSYDLYYKYGTSLRGLIEEGYKIEPLVKFYQFAHTGFSYDGKIEKNDTKLQSILHRMKSSTSATQVKLFLFTNSDTGHATRIMQYLGIADMFDGIITFEDLGLECKPHKSSYEIAMSKAGIDLNQSPNNGQPPVEIVFVDDNIANVTAAIEFGWTTVAWINERQSPNEHNVIECQTIHDLERVCPELFTQ